MRLYCIGYDTVYLLARRYTVSKQEFYFQIVPFQTYLIPYLLWYLLITISKYSQEFLGQQMIRSIYWHIITGIIQLWTNLKINSKTSDLILINITNIASLLGVVQIYYSQYIQNINYACFSSIFLNISGNLQEFLFQYCEIYHITMRFYDIHLPLLRTPQTLTFSSFSRCKRGVESFSLFVIWPKQIYIEPGKRRQIFQKVRSKRKNKTV